MEELGTGGIIAIFALMVSIYGGYATRRHNRLSVVPYLTDHTNSKADKGRVVVAYEIINAGIGPAKIHSFRLFYRKQIFESKTEQAVDEWIRSVDSEKLRYKFEILQTGELGKGSCLLAGQSRCIAELAFIEAKLEHAEEIKHCFDDLGIVIEYESLYGQRFKFVSGRGV